MKEDSPSRTAAGVAFRRAAHQLLDQPPIFHDPVALLMLSPEARARLESDPTWRSQGVPGSRLRAFLAVRSRVAEDRLAAAVAVGVRQYVVLGAGLDTFALRNPFPDLRIFEVDHPRTQAWKLKRLQAAGLIAAGGTAYVSVDFETQTVAHELASRDFDGGQPTVISWLGVVPYLEEPTVWGTLEWAATVVGTQGCIVFDYGSKPRWWQLGRRLALRGLGSRVAAAGEPFRTMLEPAEAWQHLRSIGFTRIEDLDARTLNARYFTGRTDGLRVAGGPHVVIAAR